MALSAMFNQYLEQKRLYADCILLFRIGDFYEMYGDDAQKASEILDLTLTSRSNGEEKIAMCGVPHHAVDTYISKLVKSGCRVAICEQINTKAANENAKIVEREVVQVVTNSTTLRDELLQNGKRNYLASVYSFKDSVGLALCDLSSGEIIAYQFDDNAFEQLQSKLVAFMPSEIICDTKSLFLNDKLPIILNKTLSTFYAYLDWYFEFKRAKQKIFEQFKIESLQPVGLADKPCAVSAVGGLIYYVLYTNKRNAVHFESINYQSSADSMEIDTETSQSLELTRPRNEKGYTLLGVLNNTKTGGGSRELSYWFSAPLQNAEKINERLDAIEEIISKNVDAVGEALTGIKDVERIISKIANGCVKTQDFYSVKTSLSRIERVYTFIKDYSSKIIKEIVRNIGECPKISGIFDNITTDDSGSVCIDSATDAIFKVLSSQLENSLAQVKQFEKKQKAKLGIKSLKVERNKVFGYYIEIPNSQVALAPIDYQANQTTTTAQRYTCGELRQIEYEVLTAEENLSGYQSSFFAEMQKKVAEQLPVFLKIGKSVSILDCLYSLAFTAKKNNYVRPKISTAYDMKITAGRHPVLETICKNYVPNDCVLTSSKNCMLITGPNMAGKSTFMMQTVLICFMAHIGSFVPAKSAQIPIIDKIYTRIGASDDIFFNKSTFMTEILQVSNIVNHSTTRSLVLLDEVGRGTSSTDGECIATAVIEYLAQEKKCKTLFSTHFQKIADVEKRIDSLVNYNTSIKNENGKITFLYKLKEGACSNSFGIEVAKTVGLPKSIIDRAIALSKEKEK